MGLSSENRSKQGGLIVGGSLNLDYNIDDNKTLGIQFNKSYAQAKSDYIDQTQYFEYSSGQFDSLVQSHNIGKNPLNQTSASLNYYSKYSNGNTFTVDAGYSNTRRNGFSHTIGESYLAENGQISRNLDFIQKVPNKIDNVSTLIDYNLNLSNDDKLSIGAAFFYTHSDNDAYYANRVHDNYERDNIKSNHFLFTELISATYVSYKRKWSDDLETTLGVRGEYLYNEGKQKVDNSKFYNNKFNIFPSVGISFKNIISYNFSSRIRRPGFMLLNPFRVYTSSDSYVVGNPFLQSANTYTQELSFVLNQKFILRASHNFTRRIWDQFLIPEENQLHYTYLNYGISHEAFLVLIHNEALVKNIWDISNTLTYGYVTNKSNTEDIKFKNSQSRYSFYTNNIFTISQKARWILNLSYYFSSSYYSGSTKFKATNAFNFRLQKRFNNFSGAVFVDDIFSQRQSRALQNREDLLSYVQHDYGSRRYGITLTYNFGNQKVKDIRSKKSGINEIKGRM